MSKSYELLEHVQTQQKDLKVKIKRVLARNSEVDTNRILDEIFYTHNKIICKLVDFVIEAIKNK